MDRMNETNRYRTSDISANTSPTWDNPRRPWPRPPGLPQFEHAASFSTDSLAPSPPITLSLFSQVILLLQDLEIGAVSSTLGSTLVLLLEGYGARPWFAWADALAKLLLEREILPSDHLVGEAGFLKFCDGAQDAKKAKRYGKIGKEIVSAVKKGGPNPISNTVLAAVLEKAKELDVPKEILERNIKRASEKGQEAYIEKVYEVYGFGGVSMVVEVLTDKINRSVAAVREVVKDCAGKMADPGSVLFKFRRARVVSLKVADADKDQLLAIALDAGAEDILDPPDYENEADEDQSERYYKIISPAETYSAILSKLREEGIAFEPDNGSELLPLATIEVDDEAMELNKELMSKLLELDDVDAVYTDQKWS